MVVVNETRNYLVTDILLNRLHGFENGKTQLFNPKMSLFPKKVEYPFKTQIFTVKKMFSAYLILNLP